LANFGQTLAIGCTKKKLIAHIDFWRDRAGASLGLVVSAIRPEEKDGQ
jgi:hypothetical protein